MFFFSSSYFGMYFFVVQRSLGTMPPDHSDCTVAYHGILGSRSRYHVLAPEHDISPVADSLVTDYFLDAIVANPMPSACARLLVSIATKDVSA